MKIKLLLILILSLALPACGLLNPAQPSPTQAAVESPTATRPPHPSDTPAPTPTVIQATVSIWHSSPEDQVPALVQIRAGFQARYPDVLFDIQYVPPEDLRRAYEVQTLNGSGPALLLGPAEWGPYLYDVGLISDLGEMVSEDLLAALNGPALGTVRYRSALVGLPFALQGIVLYRNKDLMTLNADTFEEMMILAAAATQGEVVGTAFERSFLYSGGHLVGLGGQWMDEEGLPTFNDDAGLAWLELLSKMGQQGATTFANDEDLEAFKAGKVAWIVDGTWNLQELAQSIGANKLAIDAWPSYGEHQLSGFVMADNLYLSPKVSGVHRQAAQKFIEYFFSADAQSKLAQVGRIPAVGGVTLDASVNGKLMAEAITALAGGATYPIRPETQIYRSQMDFALQAYFQEQVPPNVLLQQAYNAIVNAIQYFQLTPTPAP